MLILNICLFSLFWSNPVSGTISICNLVTRHKRLLVWRYSAQLYGVTVFQVWINWGIHCVGQVKYYDDDDDVDVDGDDDDDDDDNSFCSLITGGPMVGSSDAWYYNELVTGFPLDWHHHWTQIYNKIHHVGLLLTIQRQQLFFRS